MSARRLSASPLERVFARSVAGPSACILWCGARTPQGYGQLYVSGRNLSVHRIAYAEFVGPIPGGLEIDHLCRVRHCVNPHHLRAVTHAENTRRAIRSSLVICRRGHALTPENVYLHKDGIRECRVCKRARNNAYSARRRAASHD
ncbi:HNH endonuclease signature motif containing protein [Streptomyces sp. Ac-502]|uniref:HNH endonuclease signature motif containing protein n=1 Tax=Streptomyces sp. Ac-502 TaxID=3342801 RepID=UPI0038621E58